MHLGIGALCKHNSYLYSHQQLICFAPINQLQSCVQPTSALTSSYKHVCNYLLPLSCHIAHPQPVCHHLFTRSTEKESHKCSPCFRDMEHSLNRAGLLSSVSIHKTKIHFPIIQKVTTFLQIVLAFQLESLISALRRTANTLFSFSCIQDIYTT